MLSLQTVKLAPKQLDMVTMPIPKSVFRSRRQEHALALGLGQSHPWTVHHHRQDVDELDIFKKH